MNSPNNTAALKRYLEVADRAASLSGDLNAKVGVVFVRPNGTIASIGWNDLPRGVTDTPERRARPDKYLFTEHAERNAIYAAARVGIPLEGCTAYQRWFPCADCSRAMVQSGIRHLFCEVPDFDDPRWGHSFRAASAILAEGGVSITYYIAGELP